MSWIARIVVGLLFAIAACAVHAAEADDNAWDPSHTWVVAVGVLKWQSGDLSSFSAKNRRDAQLVKVLQTAGVPADHVVYLPDNEATLNAINSRLESVLAQTQPGDTLVFYYCGHGWTNDEGEGFLGNYDAGDDDATCFSAASLADKLADKFHGKNVIMLADCCQSGSLADALEQQHFSKPYSVITSAVTPQSSTSNWTFTQAVIDSLRGHSYADSNKDGVITFDELGAYVKSEMKQLENQDATVEFGNAFPANEKFASVKFAGEATPKNVEVLSEGEWWKAKELEVKDGKAKVRWVAIGYDTADDDEWVEAKNVRSIKFRTDEEKLKVGSTVDVMWKHTYYPAVIQKVNGAKYLIHYTGYEDNWDEWVSTARIRQ